MSSIAAAGGERKNDMPSYCIGECSFMFDDHHDLASSPGIVLGIDAVIPANVLRRICIITQTDCNFAASAAAAVVSSGHDAAGQ